MTFRQMIDRIVDFKTAEHNHRTLRDFDPICADAVNHYWEAFGPFGTNPCKSCIDNLFHQVESKVASKLGEEARELL